MKSSSCQDGETDREWCDYCNKNASINYCLISHSASPLIHSCTFLPKSLLVLFGPVYNLGVERWRPCILYILGIHYFFTILVVISSPVPRKWKKEKKTCPLMCKIKLISMHATPIHNYWTFCLLHVSWYHWNVCNVNICLMENKPYIELLWNLVPIQTDVELVWL